ncbi:MAG: T9SS type A sorting domain-containing protein [Paludibacter sp.]|nr:T9SS type A sorting domain-containing protein [Paludibacter sp.]
MKKYIISLSILLFVTIIVQAQNEKIVKFYDTKAGSSYHSIGTDFGYIGDSIMIFQKWSTDCGYELWRTNGTTEGTYMVKDIDPVLDSYDSPNSSHPEYFHTYNDKVYFRASDGIHGFELWCTDGTEEGTTMVKDIAEGSLGALNPTAPVMCVYKDELYFHAKGSYESGQELWKTDGTESGTVLVKDILPEDGKSSYPNNFIVYNNLLFFTARTNFKSNYYFNEIWYTDGTPSGTLRLSNLPAEQTPETDDLMVFNGMLIFKGKLDHGLELWKTDGTSEGTQEIKDINPDGGYGVTEDKMVELNAELFFKGKTEELGYELWKTDGTEAGTVLVKDINPGMNGSTPYSSTPYDLCAFDNKIFFAARNEDSGTQLWVSDGTTDGTVLFYGHHDNETSTPRNLLNFNNRFYFTMNTSVFGQPYLYSIGSSTETPIAHEALDFQFMNYNRAYGSFFTLKNTLCFQAELENNTGAELYKLVKDVPECALDKLPKPTGITEVCENINVNIYSTINSNPQASINWVIEPETAGSLSATGNDVRVTWNLAHIGDVKLWAYLSENDCVGENSDTLTIERFALPEKAVISEVSGVLISTPASGFQWYIRVGDAINGYLDPINGATGKSYSPTEDGAYVVEVANQSGCTSLSEPYDFTSDQNECSLDKLPKPTGITEVCKNINVNIYSTINSNPQASINWVIEPETAGSLSATGNDVRVTWNLAHIGDVKLWAYLSENDCVGENSDTLTIERFALPEQAVISEASGLLISTPASGFQWYIRVGDVISGYLDPISGATEKSYIPTEDGAYVIEVANKNGCTSLSEAYDYVNAGLNDKQLSGFSIYPNPTNGRFSIQLDDEMQAGKIIVADILGKIIKVQEIKTGQNTVVLDVSQGIYFVNYSNDNQQNGRGQKMIVK